MHAETSVIRLLLVDEAGIFRDGLENLLAVQKDFEVSGTADSAARAVEQLRAIRPDVVLLGWPPSSPPSQRLFSTIQDAKLESRVIVLTN